VSVKTDKPRMFCSPLDVILLVEELGTEIINISPSQTTAQTIMGMGQVEDHIIRADAIILESLRSLYGADSATTSNYRTIVPWCTRPVPMLGAADPNTGSAYLLSVTANYTAAAPGYTAAWIITFSSTTAYGLVSTREGLQSTTTNSGLTTTAAGTSTNGDITIATGAWMGTPAIGDKFYFSYIDTYPILHSISVWLATSFALEATYVDQSVNESNIGAQLFTRATKILNKLQRPDDEDGMKLSSFATLDLSPIQVGYPIDEWGGYVGGSDVGTDRRDTYND